VWTVLMIVASGVCELTFEVELSCTTSCRWSAKPITSKQSRRKGSPYPMPGGRAKRGPPNLTEYFCYGIYRDTRTELTNNWFHTFNLSIFIFIWIVKEIDLHATRNFLKPTIGKCIMNSFVVSICLGKLAVVHVTSAESTLIAKHF